MATRRSTIYVDSNGRTRQTLVLGNASLASVQAALLSVSNADYQSFFEGTENVNGGPAPVVATYQTVSDYVALIYTDGSGTLVYLTLPAPKSTIFLADQETVNPVAIATVNTAVIGTVLTSGGNPVTAFVAGVRRSKLKEYQ